MSDTYSIIQEAIKSRRQIIATYKGHRREMCPHVLGTKNGKMRALFFQFGGSSQSGLPAGGEWRCIAVADLSNVITRDGDWHTGSNRTGSQTCVDEVHVEVPWM
ncbi:MAG: hypothetical protein AB7V42_12385 [Thermoleophilia bacterium]